MKSEKKQLIREQLDKTLNKYKPLIHLSLPLKGWIRAIRYSLGISGRQLAKRLGVTKQRITLLEHDEVNGSATIRMMKRVANALDCVFVYGLVPRVSLEEAVRNRAKKIALKRINRVNQTMLLEDQNLSEIEMKNVLQKEINNIIKKLPKDLWDNYD